MLDDKPFNSANICQLGIVVKNIDETVKYFGEVFGIGPFEIIQVNYTDATYHGEKVGYCGKRAFGKMGPLQIELIELIDGKTIHEDFLNQRGEGLHHIAFETKNLKESIKKAEALGLKITQGWSRADGLGFAYLDSDKVGGVIFEMIQWPADREKMSEVLKKK
jgi:catechol 2,3-dioxygenase-like lactoylglutathione lyase family enzyme